MAKIKAETGGEYQKSRRIHPKINMGVSKNSGTPKSSILIGFSIIKHPFWGTPIFGNTHIEPEVMMVWKMIFLSSGEFSQGFHVNLAGDS